MLKTAISADRPKRCLVHKLWMIIPKLLLQEETREGSSPGLPVPLVAVPWAWLVIFDVVTWPKALEFPL